MRLATFSFLFLALVVFLVPLSAQMYTGVNPVSFVSSGDETTTTLTSAQLVGRFTFDSQKINFMMKAPSLAQKATDREQDILNQVLQVESNRLWIMEIDVASIDFGNGGRQRLDEVELPVTVKFNGEIVETYSWVSMTIDSEQLVFHVQVSLSLQDLNLRIPGEYADRFSNEISLITEGILSQR